MTTYLLDANLLIASNDGVLATLDRALAARFPKAAELVTDR